MLALMLTAPFLLTRYCWPSMKKQKWGRIVNIGSIHALIASPFKVGYIAAKHGLVGLTRTAALEGGEFGITVNAICPAYVRTPLVDNQIADQAKANNMSPEEGDREDHARARGGEAPHRAGRSRRLRRLPVRRRGRHHHWLALTMDLGWTAR
jgi:3-hydroxybutyrate dehydrogenase